MFLYLSTEVKSKRNASKPIKNIFKESLIHIYILLHENNRIFNKSTVFRCFVKFSKHM